MPMISYSTVQPPSPNLWKVDCRWVPPAGVTPSPCDYSEHVYVEDGTTAVKRAFAEQQAFFEALRFRNQAGSTWSILASNERNDLYPSF